MHVPVPVPLQTIIPQRVRQLQRVWVVRGGALWDDVASLARNLGNAAQSPRRVSNIRINLD